MLEVKSVIDQVEMLPNGTVQVRIAKQILNDGVVIKSEWHRTSFDPGVDISAQLNATNAHLVALGYGALSPEDTAKIVQYVQVNREVTGVNTPVAPAESA